MVNTCYAAQKKTLDRLLRIAKSVTVTNKGDNLILSKQRGERDELQSICHVQECYATQEG